MRGKFIGRSVHAAGGPAAAHRAGPLRRRHLVSRPAAHARGALADCARHACAAIDASAALAAAGRACGVDRADVAAHSADRLPPDRPDRARAVPPVRAGAATACAMSASRSPWCSPTIAYLAEDAADLVELDIEELAAVLDAARRAGRVRRRALRPSRRSSKRLRRRRRRLRAAPRMSSSSICRSAAIPACRWRRAARSRRYDAARDCSRCTAPPRCRTGIATASRGCSAATADSVHLYEGHVGGGFGIRGELYPEDVLVCAAALRFERPVKWIEDRREHLIAANHSRQQRHQITRRGRRATAASSASTTSSSTTRAPMCAPMRRPCPTSPPRCCPGPTACRPIARAATSGSPTRRRAAPIARPAATRAPSCASG